jgi:predicted kinase
MPMPHLIIVTGPPASGKTTLAKEIARSLRFPLLVRDEIKSAFFNTVGWSDREWSKSLGALSFGVMYHLLEAQLEIGVSIVVETAFRTDLDTAKFQALLAKYPHKPIQVHVTADEDVRFKRFSERAKTPDRHPGHVDEDVSREDFGAQFGLDPFDTLPIGGHVIEIDSTDFSDVDDEDIVKELRLLIQQ